MESSDLNGAVGWAKSIADQERQDSTLQRIARQFMFQNPTDGANLLAAAGVPANLIPQPGQQGPGGGGRRGGP
jgi:hypothetical protein